MNTMNAGVRGRKVPAAAVLTAAVAIAMAAGCSSSNSNQSSDATLKSLTISAGTLSPAFSPTTDNYGATVSNATTSVTVTPTVNESHAKVEVVGVAVASGSASAAQSLTVGPNLIDIAVTAEDGSLMIYDVTVTRGS